MLKYFRRTLLLVVVMLPVVTAAAININPTSVKGLAQAYGFVLGQGYSLLRITTELPEFSKDVTVANARFDATFPDIKTKLEMQLKEALGDKGFQEVATTLRSKVKELAERQKLSKEIAADFLEQVKARSKGEIESPVLEYLLTVKYANYPMGEFSDGFRQRYQTSGDGKSQGIKLKLQIPKSWLAKEGERPHIVQKWIRANGTGFETISLDIRDAEGVNPTKKEMEEFVKSGEVKETVPEGGTYVDAGTFSLEQQNGYWMQMALSLDRAGMKMYQQALLYQLFFRGKAVGIMCGSAGADNEKQKVNEAFKQIRPLCQQVLNSLVLLQVY